MKQEDLIRVTYRNPQYFIELYFEYRKTCRTGNDAYECVEDIHRKFTLIRRYRNYEIFKVILNRFHKTEKKHR